MLDLVRCGDSHSDFFYFLKCAHEACLSTDSTTIDPTSMYTQSARLKDHKNLVGCSGGGWSLRNTTRRWGGVLVNFEKSTPEVNHSFSHSNINKTKDDLITSRNDVDQARCPFQNISFMVYLDLDNTNVNIFIVIFYRCSWVYFAIVPGHLLSLFIDFLHHCSSTFCVCL